MYRYLQNMEARMNNDQRDMLRRIWEPTVVVTPLGDSRRDICILPDGEIRSYGRLYGKNDEDKNVQTAYLSSVDGGISWTRHYAHGIMNACTYFPTPDLYITACDAHNNPVGEGNGLWVLRSKIGPDDPAPEIIKLSDGAYGDTFLPRQSAYSNRIWFTTQCTADYNTRVATFFFSDDWGKTWERRELPQVAPLPVEYPHKGPRWCIASGTEPNVVELSENNMMMLIRTPTDCFYKSHSYDGGNTWSTPEPSTFWGTNTTAFLLRLSDGRVLTFWNNTKPLPEADHRATLPPVDEKTAIGRYEDVFTNRDAAHAAISEDGGKTFLGYREILLNPVRNNTDFRYVGGVASSNDKSVHQFQAFELPFGKILVSAGQNEVSRRLVIFDVNWLYETSRREDFRMGLGQMTTHTYVRSISGCTVGRVGNGHCSWNRAPSAYLMPDPEGGYAEMLYICKRHDDRLWGDVGGAAWNFPASEVGRVSVELKLVEKTARITLTDRWYNPCDPYAAELSPFAIELDAEQIGSDFVRVDVDFDTLRGEATVSVNGAPISLIKMKGACTTGISYLLLQCATEGDSKGFYVRLLEKTETGKNN